MTRRQMLVTVVVLLMVLVLAATVAMRLRSRGEVSPLAGERESPTGEPGGDPSRLTLYFPGGGGWLVAEEQSIETENEPIDLRTIAAEVLAGPESPSLYAPFPAETEVGSVFVSERGIAYVDLVSTQADPPRSGSRQEMLSVYSLVNSVQSNVPELSGVVLLWNGQQRGTFAGHLDTGQPLAENLDLVARSSRPAPADATPAAPTDPSRP